MNERKYYLNQSEDSWKRLSDDAETWRMGQVMEIRDVPESVTDEEVIKRLNATRFDIPVRQDPVYPSRGYQSSWCGWLEIAPKI